MPVSTETNITISVSRDTHDKLDEIGKHGENYGQIVARLVAFYEEHNAGEDK